MRLPHRLARRGASGSEYGFGVGLVAVAALAALLTVGGTVSDLINQSAETIAATAVAGNTNTASPQTPNNTQPALKLSGGTPPRRHHETTAFGSSNMPKSTASSTPGLASRYASSS